MKILKKIELLRFKSIYRKRLYRIGKGNSNNVKYWTRLFKTDLLNELRICQKAGGRLKLRRRIKNMKKVFFVLVILAMMLSGCNFSTPRDIDLDEWALSGPFQNGRSARIDDVVLYDCTESYGTFIKLENEDTPKKLEDISKNFAINKISSSNQYFYLSGKATSNIWGASEGEEGTINVLVVDRDGNVVAAKKSCCLWVYACEDTILGYYSGDEEDEWDESYLAWEATRREITHYCEEEEFLKSEEDDIDNWTKITGKSFSLVGKEWFRKKENEDEEYSVPYYTDTVYSSTYHVLNWMNYWKGREVSGLGRKGKEKSKKYVEQMQDIMGGKEKNFEVSDWQTGDKLFVIYRVYREAGGYQQHFTKDIECSLLFQYDPDKDSVILKETYEGKEVAYWDGDWVIYRKDAELFVENLQTHEVSNVFKSDVIINIDVSGDVVTLWDIKDAELIHSSTFILQ